MDVKRQQGGTDQGDLFDEALKTARRGVSGEGGNGLRRPRSLKHPRYGTMNEP